MRIPLFNFLKGQNSQLSPMLYGTDILPVLDGGVITKKLGAILKDLGYSRVSTQLQANKSILGLYDFHQTPSTQKLLATVDDATSDDTQLFYKTPSGAWTEVTDAETAWANFANMKVEMESFIGRCFFVGYGATDGFLPIATLTGTTFSTVDANLTGMAQAKCTVKYRNKLFLLNVKYGGVEYPYRFTYSDDVTAGAITWDNTTNFGDVDYAHELIGGAEMWDKLIMFTEYDSFYYDESSLLSWYKGYGCSNHRTIKASGSTLFWASSDAVYASNGGEPVPISGPIEDFIQGSSNPRNFFSTIIDEEYVIYVGTVTVGGLTFTNCECIFNIKNSTWRVRENAKALTAFAKYNSAGQFRRVMGATTGDVWDKSKYTDTTKYYADGYVDVNTLGTSITAFIELPPLHLDSLSVGKTVKQIVVYAERAQGVKVMSRIIDASSRILTKYEEIGKLSKYVNVFDVDVKPGNLIQFAFTETSKNEYFSIFGIEAEIDKYSDTLKTKR